jgi:hypothetical protein
MQRTKHGCICESKFGYPIARYASTAHAITTFPTTAGAVGIRPTPSGLSIFAPFGLSDLFGLMVRPNKTQITRAIYETKAACGELSGLS